jgi:excinuclease ABC subunit C
MDHLDLLREHVRSHAENRPGVYRMTGPGGEILYVGKSIRLRSRLLSYFRAQPHEKATELVRTADRILWDYEPNEFAALLTEMRQIKAWRPRFNVEHNRKRIYAFAKITAEPAPRILAVTRVVDDGAEYFGPFPNAGRIIGTMRELSLLLGLRDCPGPTPVFFDDQLEVFSGGRLPLCIRAELATCLAPCAGRCSEADYHRRVATARAFLSGAGGGTLSRLRDRMDEASTRLDFEYAALLRNRLLRLERLQEDLVALRGRGRTRTFLYHAKGYRGNHRLYLIREGRVAMDLPAPFTPAQKGAAAQRIRTVLATPPAPGTGLTAAQAAEVVLVGRWFRLRKGERKRTTPVKRWLREAEAAGEGMGGDGTGPSRSLTA